MFIKLVLICVLALSGIAMAQTHHHSKKAIIHQVPKHETVEGVCPEGKVEKENPCGQKECLGEGVYFPTCTSGKNHELVDGKCICQ